MIMEKKQNKPKVLVVGAGLVGNNVAYYLAKTNQFHVQVVDAAPASAMETSKANAGRFVPFVMKYGGTVGASMKRLLLPESLRERLVPNFVDQGIPNIHHMQCTWSLATVKFGLMNWYANVFHNHAARPKFIDYCSESTQMQLQNMDLSSLQYSQYNLLVKPWQHKSHLHRMFFESTDSEELSTKQCLVRYPFMVNMLKDKNRLLFRVTDFMLDSRIRYKKSRRIL